MRPAMSVVMTAEVDPAGADDVVLGHGDPWRQR
jgi:hypothetical protein